MSDNINKINKKRTVVCFDPQPNNDYIDEILDINVGDILNRENKTYVVTEIEYNFIGPFSNGDYEVCKRAFTKLKIN